MVAGGSALREADRARRMAEVLDRRAAEEWARHERFFAAGETEARVAWRLRTLEELGWVVLTDRRWPETLSANVDLLAVGPGGVLVIDVKAWHEPRIEDGRLYRGDADCTDDVDRLLALTASVEESVAELGLTPVAVLPVIALAGHASVRARVGRVEVVGEPDVERFCAHLPRRLSEEQVHAVAVVLARDFPAYDDEPVPVSPVVPDPVLPRVMEQCALFDTQGVIEAELAAALAGPLDTWMTWLHPQQTRLVRRSWNGPVRLGGPAGTGKTVVALHRAAYFASTRPGRVLFVSFVKTLPEVLRGYFATLAPTAVGSVEFTGLHRWAMHLLDARSVRYRLDGPAAADALATAWQEVGSPGPLGALNASPAYWKDEIDRVVKGRGLTEFTEYADLDRVGRRMSLRGEHRAAVWDLYQRYDELLRAAGAHDFNDVLALALREVRREPLEPRYSTVIVDEVQDLTCVAVQLLHAVAGDTLFLVGDGRQAVYPGGFRLAEAGVTVTGRSVVLRTNYRNAAAVVRLARLVGAPGWTDDDAVDAVDGAGESLGDADLIREGGVVHGVTAPDPAAHDAALLDELRGVLATEGVAPGEVALLAATNAAVDHYLDVLTAAGIGCANLLTYQGVEDGLVKVGTFKRAKGLEFKYVLLPRIDAATERRWGESDAAYAERCEVLRREVHVGITRARDGVWVGGVGSD